jgi:hypothetical protein
MQINLRAKKGDKKMNKITIEDLQKQIQEPTFVHHDKIKSLYESNIITAESAILLFFVGALRLKDCNYSGKTISQKTGVDYQLFRNIICKLSKDGILHRCGSNSDRARSWALGKQEDCKRKIGDKYCCEHKNVAPKLKDGVSKISSNKEIESIHEWDWQQFKKFIQSSIPQNNSDTVTIYTSILNEIGIDYRSKHSDRNALSSCEEYREMTPEQVANYVYKRVLPQIKGKSEILNKYIYPSNMFKAYDEAKAKKEQKKCTIN